MISISRAVVIVHVFRVSFTVPAVLIAVVASSIIVVIQSPLKLMLGLPNIAMYLNRSKNWAKISRLALAVVDSQNDTREEKESKFSEHEVD